MALPATSRSPLTGDNVFDVMSSGYKWDVGSSKVLNWSVSNGFLGEFWFNPSATVETFRTVFATIAPFIDVKFNFVGFFNRPTDSVNGGSDLNLSLDGSAKFPSSVWAYAHFPTVTETQYAGAPGDAYLNIFSQANALPSYAPGSAGFALALHEIGHTLGLKHPHDRGPAGGPILSEIGLGQYDKDWAAVMSYHDDFQWNLIQWEPATYMVLDVLALQAMYGANRLTNSGNSTHNVVDSGFYSTIWDAGGTDTVNASHATQGWTISLPNLVISSQTSSKVGFALPTSNLSMTSPITLTWLIGDMENARGSAFADHLIGSDLNNALRGDRGNDILEGGNGTDTAVYAGARAQYTVRINGASATVTDSVANRDGVDTLTGVERLSFADGIVAIDLEGNAGQAYRLYQAALDRTPDKPGLSYWVNSLDHGMALSQAAASFIVSNEFKAAHGDPAKISSSKFLDTLYANILGRAPDPGGKAYWLGELDHGFAREKVLASFSESVENKGLVGTVIANGILLDSAWFA